MLLASFQVMEMGPSLAHWKVYVCSNCPAGICRSWLSTQTARGAPSTQDHGG